MQIMTTVLSSNYLCLKAKDKFLLSADVPFLLWTIDTGR